MTRYLREQTPERNEAAGLWGVGDLRRRPAVIPLGGNGIYAIKVFEDDELVSTGDGKFEWEIPEDLDDAVLLKVEAFVTTVSSSGGLLIQVANERAAGGTVDMLSTRISIDASELNSKDAASQPVVDTANDDVVWGDHLRIDVDSAGTGAKGLGVTLYFIPLQVYTFAVQGQQGDPGGITAWEGAWATSTSYQEGDAVSHNGSSYAARQDHTSGASSEPGVGASWTTYWMLLAAGSTPSAWTGYTPSLTAATTNPTLGSGSQQSGRYTVIDDTVIAKVKIHFGTSGTGAGSGVYYVSVPVTGSSSDVTDMIVGHGLIYDSSGSTARHVYVYWPGSDRTKVQMYLDSTTGLVAHNQPWAWDASDQINIMLTYESA